MICRSGYEYIIPAVLALVRTIGLIHIVPALSTHYLLKVERTGEIQQDYIRNYHDLKGDGTSKIIELFYNTSENLAVKFRYLSEATINQFYLPGRLTEGGKEPAAGAGLGVPEEVIRMFGNDFVFYGC
ncbi:MAG: hypothetical protein GY790_12720 [Bacteroidetes bacterium]|nr:hypothetical protein [Bacteroidota bacterium]